MSRALSCLLALAVVLSACRRPPGEHLGGGGLDPGAGLHRYDDPKYPVVCWMYQGAKTVGISCLPKASLSHEP